MAFRVADSEPSKALRLSQKAPSMLSGTATTYKKFPWTLLEKPESLSTWTDCERLFLACLTAGDDQSAHLCLEKLSSRFGASDLRVMGLRGMYQESNAKSNAELERVLQSYEKILQAYPMNKAILKRRIAVKKSLSRPQEAIAALVEFLQWNATDAEAWCELADLYLAQGMTAQAAFSMEEALLIAPHAWNLHARLGEVDYISAVVPSESTENSHKLLADSIRRFARSIELCDDYVRGYYGLKKATKKLADGLQASRSSPSSELPPIKVLNRLHDMACQKLKTIISERNSSTHQSDAAKAELLAAQQLLDDSK